ncbi:uncharacterized protein LOC134265243 [Saccostrea cucullata]|uniref:uncharacterized protein LOC134265243 n=1 Tax=Saccostrea cuccullata TaxID=36930 RepID=UPI002ED2EC64
MHTMTQFLLFVLIFLVCFVFVPVSCYQQCHANPLVINPTAQVRFAVVSSIRQSTRTEECYKVSQNAVQYLAAIEWAVNVINSAGYLKILSLGFDIYDDCGLDRLSTYSAMNAVSAEFPSLLTSCGSNRTIPNLGILGTSRSQTSSSIVKLLDGTKIPMLSPFASLPELSNYDNFLRTTPSDTEQVKAIVQLLLELRWTYVAAIHTNDNYGFSGINEIKALAKSHNICVDVVVSVGSSEDFSSDITRQNLYNNLEQQQNRAENKRLGVIYFGNKNVIKSLLSRFRLDNKFSELIWIMTDFVGRSEDVFSAFEDVSSGYISVSSASTSVIGARNHYEEKWRNKNSASSDPIERLLNEVGNEAQESYRLDYVRPVVDAVFAMATAFNDVFKEKCQSYTAMCDGFEEYLQPNFLQKLKTVDFSYSSLNASQEPKELIEQDRRIQFTANGDYVASESTALYDINVFRNGQFVKVGEFVNQTLQVNNSLLSPYSFSSCSRVCENCQMKPEIPYRYYYGGNKSQAIILGIFPLHTINDTSTYSCGELNTWSYFVLAVEAFFFAVKEINQRTSMDFSALAFDDCYSHNRISLILSQFLSGKLKIPDGRGNFVDPDKIVTVIGAAASGVTVPMTFQFTSLGIPVISYASSSPDLDDRVNYPYFLRTVPSDVDQARAMIEIAKHLKWQYIGGILYVNNNYGSKGKELLKQYANESDICIGKAIEIEEGEDNLFDVIDEMKRTGSDVFLYFGTDVRLKSLLEKMKKDNYNSVVFLASEDWGERQDILDEFGDFVKGSITSKFETRSTVDGFGSYLASLKPNVEASNDWFRDFWANFFNCNPPGMFDKTKDVDCPDDKKFTDTNLNTFLKNQRIVHVMNAVYAVGTAMEKVKDKLCMGVSFPCKNIKGHVDEVVTEIQNVELTVAGSAFSVFNSRRNGNVGFQILNIQKNDIKSYQYRQVGEYRNDQLTLTSGFRFYNISGNPRAIRAGCTADTCSHCVLSSAKVTTNAPLVTTETEPEAFRMAEIILIILIGTLLVLFILSLIVITRYFKSKMKDLRIRVLENKPKVMYVNEDRFSVSNPIQSGNGITFQNPGHSNGSVIPSNDGSSGLRGHDNQAFLRESYNHLADGSGNSPRVNRLDYSPLSQYPPGVNPDMLDQSAGRGRTKRPSESQEFRPELPPRDHPPPRKYNSSSSLDSGGANTPTVPKMGITRSMLVNGQTSNDSGTPSPTGPKTGRMLPYIDPVTQTVSPLASPTHSSSSSGQRPISSPPRGILRTVSPSDQILSQSSPGGVHRKAATAGIHSHNGSVSPEEISAEFPPPPDFTQLTQASVPQTAKIKARISSNRSAEEAARISRV